MYPAAFEYFAPTTIGDALALLGKNPDAKLIAGGHSLLPMMKLRLAQPPALIDIGKIADLRGISDAGDTITIGALTTHDEIESSALLREACPLLPEVAAHIGDLQVRNRGTIGGSLAHADPAADYPAAMLALNAKIDVVGPNGKRTINAEDLFTGVMQTSLAANEIITAVRVPKTNGEGDGVAYEKFPHPASRYAVAGVAVWVNIRNGQITDARIGITGAADHARRAGKAEAALKGKPMHDDVIDSAAGATTDGWSAIGDLTASPEYRAHLVTELAHRALHRAHHRAHHEGHE